MKIKNLWKSVLADLELSLSKSNYQLWIKATQLTGMRTVDEKRQIVTVACRTSYQKNMVESRYYGQIKEALDRVTGKLNELVFTVEAEKISSDLPAGPLFEQTDEERRSRSEYDEAVDRVRLRKDYTFESFAVSSTNEMAHAAASAVGRAPGKAYQLLFLYGGVGVGKTHLMTATGHEILKQNPKTSMVFCSGEEFTNALVQAIQTKKTIDFKARFRGVETLLVDDIQFIAGKDAVQEEFFHTFNAIVQKQGQIVLTSDKLPGEMPLLEDRLRSRFEGGLIIDIQEPNFELRTAILQIKARARGVELPMDVAQMVAQKITSTRRLEGFLVSLISLVQAKNLAINPELLKQFPEMKEVEEVGKKKYVAPQEIVSRVAEFYGLKPAQLKGKRRLKEIVNARHIAMVLLREDLEIPLTEVGRILGGKDHTTVMHAEKKINILLNQSEKWRQEVEEVRKMVFIN